MRIIDIVELDVSNYKKASMFIITCKCSFKCDKENGTNWCQNSHLANSPTIDFSDEKIVERYLSNPMTNAIVFGGLEPLDQYDELIALITKFREQTQDDIVIYTGYTEEELKDRIPELAKFKNIIVKFGRFKPYNIRHFDKVLGVDLASDNQYAKVLKELKIRQSSDKDLIKTIDEALNKNKELYGERYCPCAIKHNEDTICPCKKFRDQTEPGPCHCGKFEKYY